MKAATVIGAAAAIGSVAFTGVATYYSAMVSRDQLEQSQEDARKKVHEQAERVTWWHEFNGGKGGRRAIWVVNRSHDPIMDMDVSIAHNGERGESTTNLDYSTRLHIYNLAPCTAMRINPPLKPRFVVLDVEFTDSANNRWVRDRIGTLSRTDYGVDPEDKYKNLKHTNAIWDGNSRPTKPAEGCGDSER